jgi:putative addiction module component (TIGR02574 family)
MRSDEIKNEIKKLNLAEKILLVEDIWDQIAESNESMPISDWQKQELDQRLGAYQKGELKTFEWQAVHDNLRKKYK